MAELSYFSIRSAHQAREAEEKRAEARKREILMLIFHHLQSEGYIETAECLSSESSVDLSQYAVCDNVDLETVLQEYETFFFLRFHRYPKICKKQVPLNKLKDQVRATGGRSSRERIARKYTNCNKLSKPGTTPQSQSDTNLASSSSKPAADHDRSPICCPNSKSSGSSHACKPNNSYSSSSSDSAKLTPCQRADSECTGVDLELIGSSLEGKHVSPLNMDETQNSHSGRESFVKPLSRYIPYNPEWKELAQIICRDISVDSPNIHWNDIIGLTEAKRLVKEAVVYPIKYPELFSGILAPWKGLLLFGPPGTGKTLLAKAVATECKTTFFNISASTIVSKWRGDSEKLVRVLFDLARYYAPSTIFLDEFDAILSQRNGAEHEGSRRMKTELLIQLDGLAQSNDWVFLLATSNIPWELDHAVLRRLEKRILVNLPNLEARTSLFHQYLPPTRSRDNKGLSLTCQLDYRYLAEMTEGYSGSDIRVVCKEVAMQNIRDVFTTLETCTDDSSLPPLVLKPVMTADVEVALKRTRPSASHLIPKYLAWQEEFGSV